MKRFAFAALLLSSVAALAGTAEAADTLGGKSSIIVVGGKPGVRQSLNPQPLPPRWLGGLGDSRSLNPQPLPPRLSGLSIR
ncbi:hypothetical protein [Azospirillum sp. TSO22-1]|uniref:hypothetical protein n=1 Tax=Azospirillum sp. TSO22-1 TaxID=716789 RepID=UPI000D60887B|nr:hypothetical protein [Azospirillum sp. TSO22-1]PWC54308.1 hypothetical protein TSO221_08670 [Azospirillum sp. TSO22-1]